MRDKIFIHLILVLSLIVIAGCYTTDTSQVPYKKTYSKYVNNIAILYSPDNPEMFVNIRNDDMFLSTLATGPAIIPQLLMQAAFYFAKKDDTRIFNDMVFDLNIGEFLCKKLNTKLQLCSYFHVVPQESIMEDKVVWKLLEKEDKDLKDYQKIGTELGADTLVEINTISYGLKDPGIFSGPYAVVKADIKVTTASEGKVLWRDIIQARTKIDMDTKDFVNAVYGDVQLLKAELEKAADVISEKCVEKLGFDTQYTYLLDRDYLKDAKDKVDIAKKLDELNNLRYKGLITDIDYNEKKLDLIERVKIRKMQVLHRNTRISTENDG